MMKKLAYGLILLGGIGLLASCASEKKSLGTALQTNDVVFSGSPETASGNVNVYTAMARAAKYNSDASVQNMLKKVYDGEENPQEIAAKILKAGQPGDKLYNAAKALDFADIYAMSVLTDNQKFIEDMLYAKSAQNLSVAAIKLHREEIFAEKEIKEIDRISSPQEKVLSRLTAKMNSGDLTEPEINYRKGLEVALNHLQEIRSELVHVRSEYTSLIKASGGTMKLEGKRFYELDDFDKRYQPDIFQDSAVTNRREFSLAKEQLGSFNAAKARRQAFVDYPPVARLDINGLEIEDSRYEAELYKKAKRATENLLTAVEEYRAKPSKEDLKQKAFDELAAVVMTQVELGYRLVEKATFDYEDNRYKILDVKEVIHFLEKKGSLTDYEKVDLLNKRIELISLEQKQAEILAERASALRQLYYLAGLSPFDKNILKGSLSSIESVLKQSFSKDLVTMLSAVKETPRYDDGGNAWAHKDNWLEELIDDPETPRRVKASEERKDNENEVLLVAPTIISAEASESKDAISTPAQETKEVVNDKVRAADNNYVAGTNYSIIQLGAYNDMGNAIDDEKEIKANVAALKGYDLFIEDGVVNGTLYHKLLVKPEPDRLHSLCQAVIDAGYECLLK